ncbi:MAG: Succinoglycan biosynthesis protein [Chloroflexi bacterium]|nr:Succinoglycan biosynthesis protein [Chloroflexota bacterium]
MSISNLQASVILCAYTHARWNDLIAAVDSIRRQNTAAGEIIVVIDNNQDLYKMALAQFPDVRVLENRGLRGLSGARNTGAEYASCPVVAFMDEDAVAEPDWLTWLLFSYQEEQVIGVGGKVMPDWLGKQPAWFPEEFAWVVGCTYKGLPETVAPVRNMLGCNMSFRQEVFDRTGGFHNALGRLGDKRLISCEETEFCIRAIRRFPHSQFVHDPRARVNHKVPAERTSWQYYQRRCFAEGLSKARVAGFVGSGDGLSSEREYTLRTLPQGILRGVKNSLLEGNLTGLLQAGAIIAGLMITLLGYLSGRLAANPKPAEDSLMLPS